MPIDTTALSSLSATLDDLTRRLGQLALDADEEDEDRGELLEIERQLQIAGRRLDKLLRRSSRKN
ncbi:MAG: hypothetical protein AAFO29_20060 [Actinomycetota bacterium]